MLVFFYTNSAKITPRYCYLSNEEHLHYTSLYPNVAAENQMAVLIQGKHIPAGSFLLFCPQCKH